MGGGEGGVKESGYKPVPRAAYVVVVACMDGELEPGAGLGGSSGTDEGPAPLVFVNFKSIVFLRCYCCSCCCCCCCFSSNCYYRCLCCWPSRESNSAG